VDADAEGGGQSELANSFLTSKSTDYEDFSKNAISGKKTSDNLVVT
jgi:hypothetical protein